MKKSKHWHDLNKWVKIYVESDELTDNLHYVSVKYCKQTFIMGVITGIIIFGMLLSWLA